MRVRSEPARMSKKKDAVAAGIPASKRVGFHLKMALPSFFALLAPPGSAVPPMPIDPRRRRDIEDQSP